MISEERLRLMTKMAIFEQENPKKFKMNEYYRHDYIGIRFLGNLLWFTVAFFLVIGVIVLIHMDDIMDKLTIEWLIHTGITVGVIYLAVMVVSAIIGHIAYGKAHKRAKSDIRAYYGDLKKLDRMCYHEEVTQEAMRSLNSDSYNG